VPPYREKAYNKALSRAVAAITSAAGVHEKTDIIVRATARAMTAGVSLVLLDATRTKLVHTSSWGLSQAFLRKGVLDADKSLAEVFSRQPVVIPEAATDARVQYPEVSAKAGIVSILGVPVVAEGQAIGTLRVYTNANRDFGRPDIAFVSAMAGLAALALAQGMQRVEQAAPGGPLRLARTVTFANPSEAEFADVLDFYNIEWVYEPRAFAVEWKDDRVTEEFTPDFYLPALDLYIEVTVIKQRLATEKNRKLRRLRQLYPEVKILLLHKNQFNSFLARYGSGPLAQARARGIKKVLFQPAEIEAMVKSLAARISADYAGQRPLLIGIQRGFLCFMADLTRRITVPLEVDLMSISYFSGGDHSMFLITKDTDLNIAGRHVILVEGVVDTGMTLSAILNRLKTRQPASLEVCTLLDKRVRRIVDVPLKYVGFEVQDEFVVGYGLDYREEYRNLPFIGVPDLEKPA